MKKQYILSIDQSTTSSKIMLIDEYGKILDKASKKHQQFYPRAGWVEQDGAEIYSNVLSCIHTILKRNPEKLPHIEGLALTNQTGAFLLWDKNTGLPVYHIIGWQCSRGQLIADSLPSHVQYLFEKHTGSRASAFLPALKLRWLLNSNPEFQQLAESGDILFGTIDSWLIWKLTDGHVHGTDYGNACITQLFNIYEQCWDSQILDALNIPIAIMPSVIDSDGNWGSVCVDSLPPWPIAGVIGDSNGALFGQCGFERGSLKITYGTGASLLINIGEQPVPAQNGLLPVISWRRNGKPVYVLEGTSICAGASLNWLIEKLQLFKSIDELQMEAQKCLHSGALYFVSAFTGLGTPYWNAHAKACIFGLSKDTGKSEIARAALEGVAYQIKDMLEAGLIPESEELTILADGGMIKNQLLMQFQADITGNTVICNYAEELSGIGAAYLAGLNLDIWKDLEQIKSLSRNSVVYKPTMTYAERKIRYQGWKEAVQKSLPSN